MSSSQGAKLPTAASSLPGRPKIAAPIMPLRARKAAPQVPTSRRVVADPPRTGSAMSDPVDGADDRVDGFVDVGGMGPEGQDRAADEIGAVDAGAAEHDPAFVEQGAKQPLIILVDVAALGPEAERDDRQVRRRSRLEAFDFRQTPVEI